MGTTRNEARRGFTPPVRLSLLEGDVDRMESMLASAIEDLTNAVTDEAKGLRSTMRWVIGSFFSVVLAIIAALAVLAFR